MKFFVSALFFLLIQSIVAQENTNKILYVSASSFKMQKEGENVKNQVDIINKAASNNRLEFELHFNKSESFFALKNQLGNNEMEFEIAKVLLGGNKKFYTDLEKEIYLRQEVAYGETFLIPINQLKWKFHKKTKQIGDYKCFLATTGYQLTNNKGNFYKEVVAWYAPEISFSFGPYGYFGLPGMILELTDGDKTFKAKKVEFNSNIVKIVKPVKGIKISQEEFEGLREKFNRG